MIYLKDSIWSETKLLSAALAKHVTIYKFHILYYFRKYIYILYSLHISGLDFES